MEIQRFEVCDQWLARRGPGRREGPALSAARRWRAEQIGPLRTSADRPNRTPAVRDGRVGPDLRARLRFRLRHPAGVARIGNIKPTSGRLLCSTRCGLPARGAGCGVPPVLAGRAGRPAVSRVPGYE
jgi:hypothetical protein